MNNVRAHPLLLSALLLYNTVEGVKYVYKW